MAGECITETLFAPGLTQEDQCAMAMANCEAASMLDFYKLYFCYLQANDFIFYPIGVSTPDKQSKSQLPNLLLFFILADHSCSGFLPAQLHRR